MPKIQQDTDSLTDSLMEISDDDFCVWVKDERKKLYREIDGVMNKECCAGVAADAVVRSMQRVLKLAEDAVSHREDAKARSAFDGTGKGLNSSNSIFGRLREVAQLMLRWYEDVYE